MKVRSQAVYCVIGFLALELGLTGQAFTDLVSFSGTNGSNSNAPLLQGSDGNFYGTTTNGGANGMGAVFKVTPAGSVTVLYDFCSQPICEDGGNPYTGLVQGPDGNFYGTTQNGGRGTGFINGTIFKITPAGVLTTVYSFCTRGNCLDGQNPEGLVLGSDGNFYGVTFSGGDSGDPGDGTVFKFTPAGVLTTLYTFCSQGGLSQTCSDGRSPINIIQGSDGNFYGATLGQTGSVSATQGAGTVFKITPSGSLTTLHTFCSLANCTDGSSPSGNLIQGTDGNFYGTTSGGGAATTYISNGGGVVFKITPAGALTVVYSFCSTIACGDGSNPSGLAQAADGSFYGVTGGGGSNGGPGSLTGGTLFRLTSTGALTTLYSFCSQNNCTDGNLPRAGVIQAANGNLYGTTYNGGANDDGVVYQFAPPPPNQPVIAPSNGIQNGASFQPGISPGAWLTIKGTNLSPTTDTWNNYIVNGALPTSLDSVKVTIGQQPAYVEYITGGQINAVAPAVSPGAQTVTVTTPAGTSQAVNAQVQAASPAFFQWGKYAVATHQDFSYAVQNGTFAGLTTVPAKPGDVIILWGTGFGPTTPPAPQGVETPSTATYNTASAVTVMIGNAPAFVYGAVLAPGFAGLYQVAIQIPASLANGDYPVVATVSGFSSPSATLITVQQ